LWQLPTKALYLEETADTDRKELAQQLFSTVGVGGAIAAQVQQLLECTPRQKLQRQADMRGQLYT
jgi:hypothetical protein